jgi:phosphonate transport system substrate-binding protein
MVHDMAIPGTNIGGAVRTRPVRLTVKALLLGLLAALPLLGLQAADLRVVVTAAHVAEDGLPIYDRIAEYLSDKTGNRVTTLSGLSYKESSMLLSRGIVQMGFICGLPYVLGKEHGDFRLLATPAMKGPDQPFSDVPGYAEVPGKYFSYTIVHKDSPLTGWQDLQGKRYVYNDQHSNSGYNMPRYKLIQLGARSWEEWFSEVDLSGSHEESIRLVARGLADASSVDSLVLDYQRAHGNPDALNVRVIEVLFPGGSGAPPVVVNTDTPQAQVAALREALLTMHQDRRGRAILDEALIDRFLPPDDHNYDDIRNMMAAAREAGFRDHIP